MSLRLIALVVVVALGAADRAFAQVQVIDGRIGPGALYRIVRPTVWNGSLLLYAHGYVEQTAPVALPTELDPLIAPLAAQGFAIAYSSFAENGWAVKDGAQRTHQLLGIFSDRFGAPSRVYLAGASMGGLIAIKLQEQYPHLFDGVLTLCSVSGGARQLYDYYAHTRALFDVVYPGILPGNAGGVSTALDIQTEILAPAAAAIAGNGAGAAALAQIDQTPVPFANPPELLTSILTSLGAHANSFRDLVVNMHGKPYFDNRFTQYSSSLLPPSTMLALNLGVGRFDAAPAALEYLERYYEPTGRLSVPMIELSMARDPLVPAFNQTTYRARVAAAGQSHLLVQRTVSGYGHCNVPPQAAAQAFAQLVVWVEAGVKPLP